MNKIKSKVFVIALAICVLAVASLGTLAWFSDSDEVKNDFLISGSDDPTDPDDIFSVDVWEDDTEDDTDPNEPKLDGIEFDAILPGDKLYKEVHIQNTGAYDQYIRATVTVTGASVWQAVYGERVVPLTAFVETIDEAALYTQTARYDATNNAFVYELYYTAALAPDAEIVVFEWVNINSEMDRDDAAALAGSFSINVVADAVQTENVGDNVFAAFSTVGLVKTVSTAAELADALAAGGTVALDAGTYTFPAKNSFTPDTTLVCEEGTVFEGNSKLNINGATVIGATFSNTAGTAVDQTINGVFKDCVFTGSNALRWCYAGETVVFENCVFTGDVYGAHFDGGANEVYFKNCTFSGFNAIAGEITLATYEGCIFTANETSGYNGINLWGDSLLINCHFDFDGSVSYEWVEICGAGKTATFKGCTVAGGESIEDVATARDGAFLVFE